MRIFLLQLFWLSFSFIGMGEVLLISKLKFKWCKQVEKLLLNNHWITSSFILFATGLSSFALVVVPGCFLEWPILVLEYFYFILLAISAILIYKKYRHFRFNLNIKFKCFKDTRILVYLLAFTALATDFAFSLHSGGELSGDAQFELAQITLFAGKHMTLADPIFGNHGVPPTVYSTSILHAVYALALTIFHKSAGWVWFYSYAFFRLIIWSSFFVLCYEFIDKKVKNVWPYIVLIIVPFLYGSVFEYAELHNTIVIAWICLFIVGIKFWLEKRNSFTLMISAILIAAAHPLNAFMSACFLILLSVFLLIFRMEKIKSLVNLIPVTIILLLPMLLYYYYPHGITSAGFNDGPSFGDAINPVRFGPLKIDSINLGFTLTVAIAYIVASFYLYYSNRINNLKISITVQLIAFLLVIIYLQLAILSFIGYLYLYIKSSNKKISLVILLAVTFLGLIVYNPVVMTIIVGRVPLWTFSRFQAFNTFCFIAPIIGLLVIFLPIVRSKYGKYFALSSLVAVIIFLISIHYFDPGQSVAIPYVPSDVSARKQRLDSLQTLSEFNNVLKNQIVYSNDVNLPAEIPGAIVTNVYYIYNQANANPAVSINQRDDCASKLSVTMKESNLHASGITRIITYANPTSTFVEMIKNRPYIHLLSSNYGYRVYGVNISNKIPVDKNNICYIKPPYYT